MSKNSFRYFKTSPEIIQLAVMMYVRFPLSVRSIEDLLRECGIDIYHNGSGTWTRSSSKPEAIDTTSGAQWTMKEVLEPHVTKRRIKVSALTFLKKAMRRYGTVLVVVMDNVHRVERL
ncbi:integrase catalytic subunit [Hyphomonas adhaerens MHS-3]|uniref:Integrase catalytic subunit n=1 Tax=Hyphomonas adhaerens MHS-3 TaxID=1280949 RepID=A0A069E9M9_9PROT|nr:integrase catalytic subunit [Hyphomonas adhaerens MHS-3]